MLVELSRSVTFLCQNTLLFYFQLGNHVVNSHYHFLSFFYFHRKNRGVEFSGPK